MAVNSESRANACIGAEKLTVSPKDDSAASNESAPFFQKHRHQKYWPDAAHTVDTLVSWARHG